MAPKFFYFNLISNYRIVPALPSGYTLLFMAICSKSFTKMLPINSCIFLEFDKQSIWVTLMFHLYFGVVKFDEELLPSVEILSKGEDCWDLEERKSHTENDSVFLHFYTIE